MFLFLDAAHGRVQVLLFTFESEKMSRKKQKALVVAHPALLGQGSSPCGVLASFQLPLQALPPHPIRDIIVP